jgi:cobalt-zinc-cadmium efflux system membrane fusion protein
MKSRTRALILGAALCAAAGAQLGCKEAKGNEQAEAPPAAKVVPEMDANHFKIERAERFALATAGTRQATPELSVTGVVAPDIARTVPVVSLATGKVVELHARLGDEVKKGQLLLRVQSSDVANAFSDYRKAVADERLARLQLERGKLLLERGAIARSALEAFEDAEQDAHVTLETTEERLRLLGADKDHPTGVVDIHAPVSGVITDQQVTNAAGVQGLPGPNPFTIADLSRVWIICDVYENALAQVRLGDRAEIHLAAYPEKVLSARVSNIANILDPQLHSAKVRLEVENPGMLKVGMFVTAVFRGQVAATFATVPASAVLHLHDRDWVFVPLGGGNFKRQEVSGGKIADGVQEIASGLQPGTQVIQDALALQNTVDNQ